MDLEGAASSAPHSACGGDDAPPSRSTVPGLTRVDPAVGHARVRLAALRGDRKAVFFIANWNRLDLEFVRELVESGSPQASAVLESLIAYLRAAVPRLGAGEDATLARELELVRAYLEVMQMRIPDRLSFLVNADPALETVPFPSMALVVPLTRIASERNAPGRAFSKRTT